jgi:long-chain acyl-CoA synthetase
MRCRGACEVFSTLRTFRDDLTAYPPDHFVCVPLVLDTLYNKVRGHACTCHSSSTRHSILNAAAVIVAI